MRLLKLKCSVINRENCTRPRGLRFNPSSVDRLAVAADELVLLSVPPQIRKVSARSQLSFRAHTVEQKDASQTLGFQFFCLELKSCDGPQERRRGNCGDRDASAYRTQRMPTNVDALYANSHGGSPGSWVGNVPTRVKIPNLESIRLVSWHS